MRVNFKLITLHGLFRLDKIAYVLGIYTLAFRDIAFGKPVYTVNVI